MNKNVWIKTSGGPLLCIERQLARHWRGTTSYTTHVGNRINDYERACGISGYAGAIDVADQQALILGDMPLQTFVWETKSDLARIVRVYYADPDVDVMAQLDEAHCHDFTSPLETIDFEVRSKELIIFDSACTGEHIAMPYLSLHLPIGKYSVMTKQFEPDDRTSAIVHKFLQH